MVRRTRQSSPPLSGLQAGQVLRRDLLTTWGWVNSISDFSLVTRDHLLATCSLSTNRPICRNAYTYKSRSAPSSRHSTPMEVDGDVIVISDDDDEDVKTCSKKTCKSNPNCLNYLGQDKWEDEDSTVENFLPLAKLGENPLLLAKDPNLPVGLKNLGATCYANASLQVWFRDPKLRSAVYNCSLEGPEEKIMETPIFQLQVTFAALQESIQSVFDPSKLVESLQLRTAEQQDAQEFSKLFMTHLDAEFKKQSNPSLQSIINEQFEGVQVYGTMCSKCNYRSERSANFWEVEVTIEKNNSKLEDCIEDFLKLEKLEGDNQYFCSQCQKHQDAIRYTKLRKLPPVLHISLLRFVFDFEKMERKKSKNTIVFPKVLNMGRFLGTVAQRKAAILQASSNDVYELRGVLLHKGPSAYHGHYEAQVFDAASNSWFQFNDEEVTQIDKLGDKRSCKKVIEIEIEDHDDTESNLDEKVGPSKRKKSIANGARKRQRIDDSEDETAQPPKLNQTAASSSDISSKDAYMLVYALRQSDSGHTPLQEIIPPSRAMKIVNELNAIHDSDCERYAESEKSAREALIARRLQVLDIYRNWTVESEDANCIVVSQQALQDWLTVHSVTNLFSNEQEVSRILVEEILCEHGRLDYRKAESMKRISLESYNKIIADTNCTFEPKLSSDDVCSECVKASFQERRYRIEHPRLIAQFNEVVNLGNDDSGYWVSKPWLRDWLLHKPKMHVPSENDPPPNSPDFMTDVCCQHGALSLSTASRRRISPEAATILTSIFPDWKPIPIDQELCSICEVELSQRKSSNQESRKVADVEKTKLKHMHEYASDKTHLLQFGGPRALIPNDFLKSWRKWVNKPSEAPRPDALDNSRFFCEHGLLNLDLSDIDLTAAVIKRSDWEHLETLYSARPLIAINQSVSGELEIGVCSDCRHKRLSNWEFTEISVRKRGNKSSTEETVRQKTKTYGKSRQSKRLQQQRETEVTKRVSVTKLMTVKDLKVAIHEEFDVPTICQRLFLHGDELLDNKASMESLNVLSNDVVELLEESESHDFSDSHEVVSRRDEGQGFGGTLLGS